MSDMMLSAESETEPPKQQRSPSNQSEADKPWLNLQYRGADETSIKTPQDLENDMVELSYQIDEKTLSRIAGSMIGMALGDALGAHVEFRPHRFLVENPVTDLQGGGTWGLSKGQFTDDTSMALCLANSLVTQKKFNPYDQLVRYKWWYKEGYMSSTGRCFDIGRATSESLNVFEIRQIAFAKKHNIPQKEMDYLSDESLVKTFDVYCSREHVAGNGALMRLAPVPIFFYKYPEYAVEYSGISGQITHGDIKAYDACRYYGALIVAALTGYTKEKILDKDFYSKHLQWFSGTPLCNEIERIAEGSYQKKGGYAEGIRGKGYIVDALEAALWAFWSDDNSFEQGALAAVNLGDDTDTTAAIYGQLAGAYYGYKGLPKNWRKHVYAKKFMINLSKWIAYEGQMWKPSESIISNKSLLPSKPHAHEENVNIVINEPDLNLNLPNNATVTNKAAGSEEPINLESYINPRERLRNAPNARTKNPIVASTSTMHKETLEQQTMNEHSTFEHQPNEAIIETPLEKFDLTIDSSSIEKCFQSTDSAQCVQKAQKDHSQCKLPLCGTQSIPSRVEYISPNWINSNQRSHVHEVKSSKLLLGRRSSEKQVESSLNIPHLNRAGIRNTPSSHYSNTHKDNDSAALVEDRHSSLAPPPISRSSTKHATDSSSAVITSQQCVYQNPTNSYQLKSVSFNSQGTMGNKIHDTQLYQMVEPEPFPQAESKIKSRQEKRAENTPNIDSANSLSANGRNNDKKH
ncbi:unnamed protein product [Rotaria socialis]|uniref:ADP-ribosylglycohydrolase n=1 Tax=Rotaria socialis TaxID=392032 RepID=A0A821FNR8_9BILA|nr:unnamed protein product [Rotaria socialis]CAF3651850.1 unnamed protein product [Rotaria socialis]CAF4654438.1 unnamed protein product [Rotaria socialis]CAF4663400.1 unnamed protein product [Rotaria socialis]